jgi:NADPH2:quinone reductase
MSWAVQIDRFREPEELVYREVEQPKAGVGEVLVRVGAAGLNYIDTYHRTGYYPIPSLPATLGVEGAGTIVEIGRDATNVSIGQRVGFVGPMRGAYAQYHVVPANATIPLPDWIDDVHAAAMLLKGMTVRYLVRQCFDVRRGTTVLVHAAAGGVGSILVQWAHELGATVIGTVGSDEKAHLAESLGCDHAIRYREQSVSERVREITDGRGVDVVYDSVGRDTIEESLASLRTRGLLVSFGQSSGAIEGFDPVVLSRHGSLFLTRPTLFDYIAERTELGENAADLFGVVSRGAVTIPARQTYPLADAAEAHRALQARETQGSTVLVVD